MNITGYVKKYGHLSFDEMDFTEADALLMAQLSYLNWEILEHHHKSIIIKDIPDNMAKPLNAHEFDYLLSERLFLKVKKSKRFESIKIKNVVHHLDPDNAKQFYAITISINNKLNVISFRGTDFSLAGWKEDFAMTFKEEIPSQLEAVRYVNDIMNQNKKSYILVGHSKGGNLAFYSAVKMNHNNQDRFINAYSFDGPGFHSENIYNSPEFNDVESKLLKFIPQDSIVGMMLNYTCNPIIIESTNINVFQHDMFSWSIDKKCQLKRISKRTTTSIVNEKALSSFVTSLTLVEREEMTNALFDLLGKPDQTILDMMKNIPATMKHFYKTFNKYSKEDKKRMFFIIHRCLVSYRNAIYGYIKEVTFDRYHKRKITYKKNNINEYK